MNAAIEDALILSVRPPRWLVLGVVAQTADPMDKAGEGGDAFATIGMRTYATPRGTATV